MKNLFAIVTMITLSLCLVSCDEKDGGACDPATCDKTENAVEMMCDDSDSCVVKACKESFKVSKDAKSCEADAPACTCDPACKDSEDCIKGEGDKCECREKDKPAVCDLACEDGKTKCECTNDVCACVPVNAQANKCDPACKDSEECITDKEGKSSCEVKENKPAEECKCDDSTTCPDGDKSKCAKSENSCKCEDGKDCPDNDKNKCESDKPASVNVCDGKSENDSCGENMACVKDGESLVCREKLAEPAPSEPTQPDKPE